MRVPEHPTLIRRTLATAGAEQQKQDCELKAWRRLLARVRADFPQLRLCLTMDSLAACGEGFPVAKDFNAAYVFVFQEGRLPALGADFQGLLPFRVRRLVSGRDSKWGFGAVRGAVIAGTPAAGTNPSRNTRGRFRRAAGAFGSLDAPLQHGYNFQARAGAPALRRKAGRRRVSQGRRRSGPGGPPDEGFGGAGGRVAGSPGRRPPFRPRLSSPHGRAIPPVPFLPTRSLTRRNIAETAPTLRGLKPWRTTP